MSCLYNPDWIKTKDGDWTVSNGPSFGVVRPAITRDYHWNIFSSTDGVSICSGAAPDRIAAFAAVEKQLGYLFFVDEEYKASAGCRCGSCEDPTGNWRVWNRDDTVNLLFASKAEAIAWVLQQHAESKE